MSILSRGAGLLRAPGATWAAIAAEGDTRRWLFRRYLPAIASAPGLFLALLGLPQGLAFRTEQTRHFGGADGRFGEIGSGVVVHAPPLIVGLVAMVLGLAFSLLAGMLFRDMLLGLPPRHGAPPDPVAATKLAIYGQTGFALAGLFFMLPLIGGPLWLLGVLYGFWLLRRGAVELLAPPPGQEGALRWAVTWRAFFASAIAFVVVLVAALILGAVAMVTGVLALWPGVPPMPQGLSI